MMFKTVSLLWLSAMFGAGLAFITQIILARQLGATEFGSFSAALATVMLIAPLAGFGVGGFWLSIFGKEGWSALRWVKPSLIFSLYSTLIVILLLIIWAFNHDKQDFYLLIILSGCVIGQVVIEIMNSLLQLEENYSCLAVWQFLHHGLRLIGIFFLFLSCQSLSVISVAIIYLAVALFLLIAIIPSLSKILKNDILLKGHGDRVVEQNFLKPRMAEFFQQTFSFGVNGIIYLIFFQSDLILLKYLSNNSQVGIYNTAFIMMSAIYLLPSVIYQKYLLSMMHRWANHDTVTLHRVYVKGNYIMFLFGIAIMLFTMKYGQYIILFLFGSNFFPSIFPLLMLSIAIPFRFVSIHIGTILVATNNVANKNYYILIAACLNLIINYFLIPKYGGIGCSVATVLSEGLLLLLYWLKVRLLF